MNKKHLPLGQALKIFCLFITAIFISKVLFAQEQISAHGIVSGTDNQGLPGVTVVVKGTQNGTVTSANGQYSITAVSGDSLIFSSVGFETQIVRVGNSPVINVQLTSGNKKLNELVVISYGTQKRKNITGSISQINANEMKDQPVAQISQKLQGKMAGVQINEASGRPGHGMSIRIRGAASINAGNHPLIVIDGQPVTEDLHSLDPDDIATITVLKDASATALYGSRAANGVVLITTKHAKPGESRLQLNVYYGIQQVPRRGRPDVMNGQEFAQFEKELYEDKIKYEEWINPATGTAEVPKVYQNPDQYGKGTDWYNLLIRQAPIQNYDLSFTQGGDKFSTFVSAGYFNQQGVIINSGYQRYSFRANNEFRPNDKIKIGFNIAPTVELDHNVLTNTDGTWQIIQAAVLTSPIAPAINSDGSLPLTATSYGLFPNPNWYRVMKERQDNYKTTYLIGNAYIELELLKGLNFKTQANIDMAEQTHNNFVPSTSVGAIFVAPPQKATGLYGTYNKYSWVSENTLTYNTVIGNHSIGVLAGYTIQKFRDYSSEASGTDYPDDAIPWLSAAATTNATSGSSAWSLLSMIGRVNYNYKGKYLLSAAIRRDGSSRFGEDRKWGVFPSISAGWIASDESFMDELSVISYLKLRGSYGLTGNNNIGNYTYASLLSTTNYVFENTLVPGKAITSLGNSVLSWETTKQLDVGIDIGLFSGRVYLTYDYYHKLTDGLLYQINLPLESGFGNVFSNVGAFKFWGHELAISSKNLTGKFKWNTNFNISFNRNNVLKLGTENTPIGAYGEYDDYWRTAVGHPVGQFYGYVYDGVYMTQKEFDSAPHHATSAVGTVRMKDINHDDTITIDDRTFIGNPNPDFLFGLTNDFTYENYDLTVAIAGAVGGDLINGILPYTENLDGVFNVRKVVANRWRSPEDPGNGIIPRTLAGTTPLARAINSRMVSDGSYLTVKNISLGYTFDGIKSKYIKKLRVYGSVQQAFVLTNYRGANPEVSTSGLDALHEGVDQTAYPVPRTYTIGLNLTF